LVEKAAQEIVERRAAKILGRLRRQLIDGGLFGDRDVDHRRQYLFDERRETLLRDGEALRRRGRVRGRVLRPYQGRQGEGGAEPEAEGGGAGLLEPGLAGGIRRRVRQQGFCCCAATSDQRARGG